MTRLILTSLIVCLLSLKSVKAATFTAISSGSWQTGGIWNMGSVPNCGSTIVIPSGFTVTINNNQYYHPSCAVPMEIDVYGDFNFTVGKLRLPPGSVVYVFPGGKITESGGGGGASSSIEIGGTEYWRASDGNVFGPASFPPGLLPIELTYFKAKSVDSKTVELNWQTATEINNKFFTVERSEDGVSFESIGMINGAGNSNQNINYAFVDGNCFEGINYYRLKQTDFNGKYSYSGIEVVGHKGKKFGITVFPNPSDGDVTVVIPVGFSSSGNELILKVADVTGKVIMDSKLDYNNNQMNVSLLLDKGFYCVSVESGNFKSNKSIVVH